MTKFFVWLSVNGKAVPQIWHNLPTEGNGKQNVQPLFIQKLDDSEKQLPLDELVLKFKDKLNDC